jgi:hypothetical protein
MRDPTNQNVTVAQMPAAAELSHAWTIARDMLGGSASIAVHAETGFALLEPRIVV